MDSTQEFKKKKKRSRKTKADTHSNKIIPAPLIYPPRLRAEVAGWGQESRVKRSKHRNRHHLVKPPNAQRREGYEQRPTTTFEKFAFLTFSKLLSVTSYVSSALGSMPNLGFPASPKPYLKWRGKNKTLDTQRPSRG